MKSTAKLEVQVICGFFIHYVSVKKAVKFQKSRFKPISSKQMHLLRINLSPKPKKSKLIYRAWIKANNENKFKKCSL